LERIGVDVIFTPGSKNARTIRELVKKTPIVAYTCDPFEFVARLARQGGNVTGVTCMTSELTGKRLQLLKEAVPTASRIVFLSEPEDSPSGLQRAQDAAPLLGIKLWTVGFKSRADMPRALDAVAKERPDALFVYPDPIAVMEAQRIADFALRQRLPSMYAYRDSVDVGGLMSYGANDPDMFRLAADQADIVAFLRSLTDDRVRCHAAPFDHPELTVSNGNDPAGTVFGGRAADKSFTVAAVGKNGIGAAKCAAISNAGDIDQLPATIKAISK